MYIGMQSAKRSSLQRGTRLGGAQNRAAATEGFNDLIRMPCLRDVLCMSNSAGDLICIKSSPLPVGKIKKIESSVEMSYLIIEQ